MADPSSPRPPSLRTARRRVGGEGEPEVFVADEQHSVDVDPARWMALAADVLAAEGVRGAAELSLLFVDVEEISDLNAQFMETDGPTDVLAFPIDAAPDLVVEVVNGWSPTPEHRGPDRAAPDTSDQPLILGDVVICPAVAVANAPEHAGTVDDELALLVVHGVLHILGHDHAEPDETARMRARELELLETYHWHGPAPPAFRQDHPVGEESS